MLHKRRRQAICPETAERVQACKGICLVPYYSSKMPAQRPHRVGCAA